MPKFPVLNSRKLLNILQKEGFVIDHTTGSHYILYHPLSGKRATIPYHSKDLPLGTLCSILRSVGISKKDLKKYL